MLAEKVGLTHLVGEKNRDEDEENIGVKPLKKEHHSDRRQRVKESKAKKYGLRSKERSKDGKRKERKGS